MDETLRVVLSLAGVWFGLYLPDLLFGWLPHAWNRRKLAWRAWRRP
jgi:hypothetical protein